MPSNLPMKPGTRPLSEVAKFLLLPSGITSTGWPRVRDTAASVGFSYDGWQSGLGRAMLSKRSSGLYAAGVGGILFSVCRQAGKTYTVGSILIVLCILVPGLKVLWTAHRTRTSDETFKSMQGMASRKKLAPHVKNARQANGQQEIEFNNGSRILFGAREQGFGRGFDAVDVEVFDEAQILTQKALDDMVPATNVSPNPLLIFMGTPPKPSDPSEVFKARRREALELKARLDAGEDVENDMLYLEVGADPDADTDDRKQWAKANPSFPHRTSETAILRMRKILADESSFRREGLGIWDDDSRGSRAISPSQWAATAVSEPPAAGVKSFAVAFSADGNRVALAGAMKHDDGVHVELIDGHDGSIDDGLAPLADWLAARWRDVSTIVLSGRAGAPVLAELLRARKVPESAVMVASTPQYLQSCAMLLDAVRDGTATHLESDGQAVLDASVAVCDKRSRGTDGAWSWTTTVPDGDETPVEAVSLALWGSKTSKRKPRGDRERKRVIL